MKSFKLSEKLWLVSFLLPVACNNKEQQNLEKTHPEVPLNHLGDNTYLFQLIPSSGTGKAYENLLIEDEKFNYFLHEYLTPGRARKNRISPLAHTRQLKGPKIMATPSEFMGNPEGMLLIIEKNREIGLNPEGVVCFLM